NRIMPPWGSPRRTASVPKSSSSVTGIRPNRRASRIIARSPRSPSQSKQLATSYPIARSRSLFLGDTQESSNSLFMTRRVQPALIPSNQPRLLDALDAVDAVGVAGAAVSVEAVALEGLRGDEFGDEVAGGLEVLDLHFEFVVDGEVDHVAHVVGLGRGVGPVETELGGAARNGVGDQVRDLGGVLAGDAGDLGVDCRLCGLAPCLDEGVCELVDGLVGTGVGAQALHERG